MIKRFVIALFVSALAVGGLGVASAQAAPTVGGGCRLSANWYVNTSATWYGDDLSYAVITSPGPLFYGTAANVDTEAFAVGNGWNAQRSFGRIGTGTSPYTYRANWTNNPDAPTVAIYVESYPNSVTCYSELHHP